MLVFNRNVTFRSIFLGLILIPLNSYWIVMMELIHNSGRSTIISIFFTSILTILFLLFLNLCLRRLSVTQVLTQQELLVVYIMVNISSGIAGHDMMQILVPYLGHAFQFATPENEWKELFWHEIPPWLSVNDKQILKGYYQGDSSLYTKLHLLGWLAPILWVVTIHLGATTGYIVFECSYTPTMGRN